MKTLLPLLLGLLCLNATLHAGASKIANSVESLVGASEVVAVGHLAKIIVTTPPGGSIYADCVLDVSENIKGAPSKEITFSCRQDSAESFAWLTPGKELLVMLKRLQHPRQDLRMQNSLVPTSDQMPVSIIDLSKPLKNLYTRDLSILPDKTELLSLCRSWAKSPINTTLYREVPQDSPIYGELSDGNRVFMVVPAEEKYREKYLALARSENPYERRDAIAELWKFPGADTENALWDLLTCQAEQIWSYQSAFMAHCSKNDTLRFEFAIRNAAYRSLQKLGKQVPLIDLQRTHLPDDESQSRLDAWRSEFSRALPDGWTVKEIADGDFMDSVEGKRTVVLLTCSNGSSDYRWVLIPRQWNIEKLPKNGYVGTFAGDAQRGRYFYVEDDMPEVVKSHIIEYFGLVTAVSPKDSEFETVTTNSQITITKYTGPGGSVKIPPVYYGFPVTKIGDSVFKERPDLSDVVIPESVISIGNQSFRDCSGITNVNIPNHVTSIGGTAFLGCSGITNISIPDHMTSIEGGTFYGCSGIVEVIIPSSVVSIADQAFSGCTQLTKAVFLGNAPKMGSQVFGGTGKNFAVNYFDGATGFTPVSWSDGSEDGTWPSIKLEGPATALSKAPELMQTSAKSKDSEPRYIHGLVLDLDGKPAANRKVSLRGISRNAVGISLEGAASRYYQFTTDLKGRFQVRLWTEEDPKGEDRPTGSMYVVVVDPSAQDAGAVSPRFYNPASIPSGGLNLTLQIQKGFTVNGRIVDYEDPTKPMKGIKVGCGNDLHVDTHTGYGGALFLQSSVTDQLGRFEIQHIYPEEDPNLSISANWLRTKIDGKWVDEPVTKVVLPTEPNSSVFEIQASDKNLFRYYGHVASKDNTLIPKAEIVLAPTSSQDSDYWGNYHHFVSIPVDAKGDYEYMAPTPWVRFIRAQAEGFDAGVQDDPAPGKYDFVLTAGKEKSQ